MGDGPVEEGRGVKREMREREDGVAMAVVGRLDGKVVVDGKCDLVKVLSIIYRIRILLVGGGDVCGASCRGIISTLLPYTI